MNRSRFVRARFVSFLALVAFSAAGADVGPTERIHVIVDTDMGLDDVAALTALASSPTVEIVAVTTVGGAARAREGAETAARLLAFLGHPEIPVASGEEPPCEPPPWRATAEGLAGVHLPPIGSPPGGSAAEVLRRTLASPDGRSAVVLALGPLTNLRRLLEIEPDLAERPVDVRLLGGPGELAWNLTADPDAAREVLGARWRFSHLPESEASRIELRAEDRARMARAPRPAARLLEAIWSRSNHSKLPLADAAIAAAVLGTDSRAVPAGGTLALAANGRLETLARGGNSSQVRFSDPRRATRLLLALWLEEPPDAPSTEGTGGSSLSRVAAFHGHLGPYVVLGYRMGLLARQRTGSAGYFDLEVTTTSRGRPPEDCFVDGIQMGTGATTGKGNLKVTVGDVPPRATFSIRGGAKLAIELRPGLVEKIRADIAESGVGAVGLEIFAAPLDDLFSVAAAPE